MLQATPGSFRSSDANTIGPACLSRGVHPSLTLAEAALAADDPRMTQIERIMDAIRELPDDASVREIADRLEFLAAIQGGLDQLDRGKGIPHEEVKRQLASCRTR